MSLPGAPGSRWNSSRINKRIGAEFSRCLLCALAIAAASSTANAQEACKVVRIESGTVPAVLRGRAPADDVTCFTFEAEAGRRASLRVLKGRNVVFSIKGVTDAQDRFTFTTERRRYEISVGQLMRAAGDEPFQIALTLDAASPAASGRAAAVSPGQAGQWSVSLNPRGGQVGTHARSQEGSTIGGGCNTGLGSGLTLTFGGYRGKHLHRIDDVSRPVIFAVEGSGAVQEIRSSMHYFAPDKAWVTTKLLPPSAADAFATGKTLTLKNGQGVKVAAFDLRGFAGFRDAMRKTCGM